MDDMSNQEKLRLRTGELVDQVWEEAAGRASPAEQVRLRGVAYDLAARLFISGRIAARPKLEVLERIISDGMERGAEAPAAAPVPAAGRNADRQRATCFEGSSMPAGGRLGGLGGFCAGLEGIDLRHQPSAGRSNTLFFGLHVGVLEGSIIERQFMMT